MVGICMLEDGQCSVCKKRLTGAIHLSIVVPMYKSENHIPGLLTYINQINDEFPGGVMTTFVIDGSPEGERNILENLLSDIKFPSQVICLSRNFGVGPALHAALERSFGCATVVFGSDLQEPADLFLTFGRKIIVEGRDVVLGQRISRDDPFMMKLFARFYWWVNRHFLANDTPKGGFDVFGLSRRAREALIALPELNTNITSQLQWIGFDREYIPFHRRARQSGKSTWTIKRKIKLFADSIYGFSGAPITLILLIGLAATLIFSTISVLTIFGSLMGWINVPGYTTLILLAAIGHSLTITACGIIGGYVFRTFENSKGRPRYIIREVITTNRFRIAGSVSLESKDEKNEE
jgi:glycosyltransferase involved in cell wall biosynthesis